MCAYTEHISSLSNLYHTGMRGFERVVTRGNKKCGLCLYLIHTFGPIACIKSDVMLYKYIYIYVVRARHFNSAGPVLRNVGGVMCQPFLNVALRVPAHRIRNAPAVLLDGCYAFIALIILFLGLFYQGTLTEYLSRNPLTNSGVKLIKMDGLTKPLV